MTPSSMGLSAAVLKAVGESLWDFGGRPVFDGFG
jgi:hypothetical protein